MIKLNKDQQNQQTFIPPNIILSNRINHPQIGYGTYKVGVTPNQNVTKIINDALSTGYRFFDCAEFYNNESAIGDALHNSSIPRNELFLCSKVWNKTIEQGREAILRQFDRTCKDLKTDYLDLYHIHWPVPKHHIDAYITLQELFNQGKIKGIGLSNYTIEDYLELKNTLGEPFIKPVVNQIQISPILYRKTTIQFFQKEGIALQAYRTFCKGKVFTDEAIVSIANSHSKTAGQIVIGWCVQKGFLVFPKSESRHRMIENYVLDFTLSQKDMDRLDSLTKLEDLEESRDLYRSTVNKDTNFDGTLEGVNMHTTLD